METLENEWNSKKYEFFKPSKLLIEGISGEKYIVVNEIGKNFEVLDKYGNMYFVDTFVENIKIPINISDFDNNSTKNLFCLSLIKYIQ